MSERLVERRRTVRVGPAPDHRLQVNASLPVQLLEINLSGVLLASKTELAVGDRGALRIELGSRSLDVTIEIRAVSPETRAGGKPHYQMGAAFIGTTAEQRMLLGELLGLE